MEDIVLKVLSIFSKNKSAFFYPFISHYSSMDIVTIDVGGKIFRTYQRTIEKYPDSLLARMISGGAGQSLFFDRDPHLFKSTIRYYRTGILDIASNNIEQEMIFWGLGQYNNPLEPGKQHDLTHCSQLKVPKTCLCRIASAPVITTA
jgi:hypothetical protein